MQKGTDVPSKILYTNAQEVGSMVATLKDHWRIVVAVGGDGSEIYLKVQPDEKISELYLRVLNECGMSGRLWPVLNDTVRVEPLQMDSTVRGSGLFDEAMIWLEPDDSFFAERRALIALSRRMADIAPGWAAALQGWADVENLNSPAELVSCPGVAVANSRVSKLCMAHCGMTGNGDSSV